MENVFNAILVVWDFFAKNILTQPAYFIGVIVLVGYLLLKKPWYECLAGFLKATVGYFILSVGSGGLVNNFRPILAGLKDRFNLDATVIDPYFGQNAIDTGIMATFGRTFGDVMVLLLIAFIANIALVRFQKYTKMRAVFTTGNVQVQQAATAFWLILFCFPSLGRIQIGVRTFVSELTESFTGISNTLLPGAVPGIDVAATFAFGSPNAVTLGFLFGALGQFLMIGLLILVKSPVVIIAGFIPLFFDNAAFAVYANNRGGIKAACILPFLSGIIQVGGSALIASWVGLSKFGGYIGMFDWATIWPGFTIVMKLLGYVGIAVVVLILVVIPQLQYRRDPEGYFLVVEDYDAYAERKA